MYICVIAYRIDYVMYCVCVSCKYIDIYVLFCYVLFWYSSLVYCIALLRSIAIELSHVLYYIVTAIVLNWNWTGGVQLFSYSEQTNKFNSTNDMIFNSLTHFSFSSLLFHSFISSLLTSSCKSYCICLYMNIWSNVCMYVS